ncbi:OmpH family outer membrane protein [Flavihumibacter sp. CACIAM 22H1]|uniref:OmpH family outer membrane protein n=1 Tax=Flavihumibacter sp. CACIAM 22H1 TaxID=1812911 RepID=UPI0025B82E38|nr:OmpH family outer membrane protein [Flavihumibacter sp. CACIAM 22H1]
MKKLVVCCVAFLLSAIAVQAQRYAIVDTRYILDRLPEYKEAQEALNKTSEIWQAEIDSKQQALNKLYKDYEAEKVMLSPELLKKREDEIFNREKEVRELQRQRFGFEGDLFKKTAGTGKTSTGQGLRCHPENCCGPDVRLYFRQK